MASIGNTAHIDIRHPALEPFDLLIHREPGPAPGPNLVVDRTGPAGPTGTLFTGAIADVLSLKIVGSTRKDIVEKDEE